MDTITYIQVQNLVRRLPPSMLPLAYQFLVELKNSSKNISSPQSDFMRLSLQVRRQIMAQQAEQMLAHYKQSEDERNLWQAGNFIDEC
jgi:hypothetical protein